MRAGAVARAEAAARDAEIPGERRQAGDRARGVPAVGALVHGAAAEHDHRGLRRRVAAGEGDDALRGDAGDRPRPTPASTRARGRQARRTPSCDPATNRASWRASATITCIIASASARVGAGPDPDHLVRLRRRLGLPDVDGHDVGAAAARRREVAAGVGLAREVGPPEQDQIGMRAHVLLRIRLEHTRQAESEGAEPPADHRGIPPLASPEVGEAPQQVRADPRAVVVGEESVAGPQADGLAPRRLHARRDQVERLVPRGAAPGVVGAMRSDEGRQQALRIADDLARRVAAHAEKAAAVRVVGIAPHADEPPILHVDEHAAQRGVAVHRTHRADGSARDHGRPPELDGVGLTRSRHSTPTRKRRTALSVIAAARRVGIDAAQLGDAGRGQGHVRRLVALAAVGLGRQVRAIRLDDEAVLGHEAGDVGQRARVLVGHRPGQRDEEAEVETAPGHRDVGREAVHDAADVARRAPRRGWRAPPRARRGSG